MMMRRRGPGLVRVAATTAVVAGTAGVVSHRQQQRYATQAAQQAVPETAAPYEEPGYTAELERLAQLKAQGIITEEEFQAKKKEILGL